MDAVLFTPNTPLPPGSSPLMAPDSGSTAGSAAGAGADFGAIFNRMQPLLGRQDLAAVLFGQSPAIGTLVAMPLGGSMAVITPEGTPPSQDSLMAFARSQGLDETAIAALWQQPALAADALATAALAQTTPGQTALAPSAVAATATPPTAAALLLDAAPAPATAPTNPTAPVTAAATGPAAWPGGSVAALAPGALVLGMHIAPAAGPASQEAAAPTPELDALALQGMRAQFLAQSQRTTGRPSPGSGQPTEALTPPGVPTVRQEAPLIELDLREDLARIAQGSLAPSAPEGAASTGLAAGDARSGGQSAAQDSRAGQTSATPQGTLSGHQLKAEHYQQLADRMGQAMAQRMLEQIDRGQWSMKIRLNPGELGQVDVRLEMRQSGLDAHFQAENPLTKELIQQGSGRLKDSFGQSGMTLASMSVSSDAERQSSGNPTPQQEQRHAAPEQKTNQAQAKNEAGPASPPKKSAADGWDLLA